MILAGLEPATPCVSRVLSPFRRVRHGLPNAAMEGLSFNFARDSSPRFIGVAEVVTEVEIQADVESIRQTNV
jgi:hypothetical protein